MQYTYVTLCKDVTGIDSVSDTYFDEPSLTLFDSKDKAFKYAEIAANEELETLNNECDKNISFGISEDSEFDAKNRIKVNYYNHNDDTTELVTERIIVPISNLKVVEN